MFKYSHPIILIIQKWRLSKMTYMDEWEYNLWLILHKKELLETERSERSEEKEGDDIWQ